MKSLSHVRLFATPWTVAHQAPLSIGFSRQEYWSGLPFPSPGDLPNPGIEPRSPALQADTLTSETPGKSLVMALLNHKKEENTAVHNNMDGPGGHMLSEISQTEKKKYCMMFICGIYSFKSQFHKNNIKWLFPRDW